jgi:hypothetical protein
MRAQPYGCAKEPTSDIKEEEMHVVINFANLLVAVVWLFLGLLVFTRHRIASYVVGGFLTALAVVSLLAGLGILKVQTGTINIG